MSTTLRFLLRRSSTELAVTGAVNPMVWSSDLLLWMYAGHLDSSCV